MSINMRATVKNNRLTLPTFNCKLNNTSITIYSVKTKYNNDNDENNNNSKQRHYGNYSEPVK